LYNANNGFINFDIIAIHKRNFSSSQFGKSIVWEFEKIKEILFAAAWGILFLTDGGLYSILHDKMISVSDFLRY
jgi:hypothetical protein